MSDKLSNGELGAEAFKSFLDQFGKPDIYTQVLLEVIFEELLYDSYEEIELDGKTVYLPSQTKQDRNKDGGSSSGSEGGNSN